MITPRSNEVDAVLGILESEDYEDPKAMARAIVKALAEQFAQRDSFGVVNISPGFIYGWGPFWTQRDAEKFGGALTAGGMKPYRLTLAGPEKYQAAPQGRAGGLGEKCPCGHLALAHGSWSKGTLTPGPGACAWKGCKCLEYGQEVAA